MTIDREMLAAYADGELGPEDAARVEEAMAADPALADEVAAHRALGGTLRGHFAPILDMPVPDRLTALLDTPPNVVDLAAARKAKEEKEKEPKRFTLPRWAMGGAIAASLALGLVIGGQLPSDSPFTVDHGQLVADGTLDKALNTQLASAQGGDAPVHILISFRTQDGRYCRGFDSGGTAGIACRTGDSWHIIKTEAGETASTAHYRQAGSASASIMAAAQEMAAGDALDAEAERAARDAGWNGPINPR